MLIVPHMDAIAKFLVTHGHPVLQVVWLRMMMQLTLVAPITIWRHGGLRVVVRWGQQHKLLLLRGVFLLGATFGFFAAVRYIPLADAVAITFIEPVLLLILSALFLNERASLDRWIASAVGFGAVMLIVKPGASTFQPASLLALLASLFFALYLLSTRFLLKLPEPPPPLVLLGYQCLPGALLLAMVVPFIWVPFASPLQLVLGMCMGGIGACSHMLLILAFDAADASYLAPLLYTEILMQAVLGWLIFGDFPDYLALCGMVLIIAVGIYLAVAPSTTAAGIDHSSAGHTHGGAGSDAEPGISSTCSQVAKHAVGGRSDAMPTVQDDFNHETPHRESLGNVA